MPDSLLELDELLESWLIALRGERKSPETIKAYRLGVHQFLDHCATQGIPAELTRVNVAGFMATLADRSASTAQLRLMAVKQFARWLEGEENFDASGVLAVRAPKLEQKVVNHLTDREINALLKACEGTDWRQRRDRALVALFAEIGDRAEEMVGMNVDDVSVADCSALLRGKGAKQRRVKFSPQTAATLDRYIRARRRLGVDTDRLWIGSRGRPLTYSGVKYAMNKRAEAAGVPKFHLHRFRHSMAVRWMKAGGSESGLMAQGGWTSRTMIDRYIKSASEALAHEEFDRLGIGVDS